MILYKPQIFRFLPYFQNIFCLNFEIQIPCHVYLSFCLTQTKFHINFWRQGHQGCDQLLGFSLHPFDFTLTLLLRIKTFTLYPDVFNPNLEQEVLHSQGWDSLNKLWKKGPDWKIVKLCRFTNSLKLFKCGLYEKFINVVLLVK